MKQYKRESGFGAVEVLIILLVVALIGFAGLWVWRMQQDKDKKSNTTSQTSTDTKGTGAASEQVAQSATYLTIKEWGVRVKLTEKIAEAYYVPASGNANAVNVSVAEFKGTGCAAEETSLANYFRFTADYKEPFSDVKEIDRNPDAVKIGDYYYTVNHPQATCSDNETTQQKAAALTAAFMGTGKTFEAAP